MVRKIQIMTDSASDISSEDEQRYGISVIPFPVTLGEKPTSAGWTSTARDSMN